MRSKRGPTPDHSGKQGRTASPVSSPNRFKAASDFSSTNAVASAPHQSPARDLAAYEVLVAVTGGIAAYKVCEVVSRLVQRGAGLTVSMTRAARRFVTPLTFQALSGRPVITDLWTSDDAADIQHISLTARADAILVAPATANTIGRIAAGLADDIVTSLIMSADSPVFLAPAMNDRMWNSKAVQRNLQTLKEDGFLLVGPEEGWLACRSMGIGRMVEPSVLVEALSAQLCSKPAKKHKT